MADTPFHFFSVAQAAELLRINQTTLYRAISRGEVPVHRVGRYYRIPASFLGLSAPQITTRAETFYTVIGSHRYAEQLALFSLPPVRVWRNTRKPVEKWAYEKSLWSRPEKGRLN